LQRLRGIQQLAASKGCVVEQAIEYWARHHDQSKYNTPTPEAVVIFLTVLKHNGNTEDDIRGVRNKLKPYAKASLVRPVTSPESNNWITSGIFRVAPAIGNTTTAKFAVFSTG